LARCINLGWNAYIDPTRHELMKPGVDDEPGPPAATAARKASAVHAVVVQVVPVQWAP
jgi:hypothetical protein